ncbi:MAG TPA: 3-oxoacyl-ACP synthase, partial [Ramlibacter sp.]
AHDECFAAGLLATVAQLQQGDAPLLLVSSDTPYPEPLNAARPLPDMMGVALLLQRASARPAAHPRATLSIELVPGAVAATPCRAPGLEVLRPTIPAARALPLLEVLARRERARLVVPLHDDLGLQVDITPVEGARA